MLFLAVLPSIILFFIIWKADKVEKEPPKLLLKLFLFGALTVVSALVLELALGALLIRLTGWESLLYLILENFIVVALVEEGGKYFVMKKLTWRHPAFNFTFDAVVYAVVASLGFATVENIIYVIGGGIGVALLRGILSVPGHVIDAVFMGCYYGMAKAAEFQGDERKKKANLVKALAVPVLMHGFYDFCLSTDSGIFLIIFFAFEIVVTILAIRKVWKMSKKDRPLWQAEN